MEQSLSLKTPGTHSQGSWLAVRLPGLEEESCCGAGRGAWGERPPQEEAPEGRFGGSLGWGSASGRQGLRLPEVSTGKSGRRGWGRGEGTPARPSGTRTYGVGFLSCALHISAYRAQ